MHAPRCLAILVIEDEALVRMSFADHFRDHGHRVSEAASGEAGLAVLEGETIDVLVTDIDIGGPMSGWDLAEAGREIDPQLSVVYMSGNSSIPERMVAGSRFFGKPCSEDGVLQVFAELVHASGASGTRYFFSIEDGQSIVDEEGLLLSGPDEARRQAMDTMGEIMRHMDGEHLSSAPWRMTVTDEDGNVVFGLEVTASSLH